MELITYGYLPNKSKALKLERGPQLTTTKKDFPAAKIGRKNIKTVKKGFFDGLTTNQMTLQLVTGKHLLAILIRLKE